MLRFRLRSLFAVTLCLSLILYLVVEVGIKGGESYRKNKVLAILSEIQGIEDVQITGFQDEFEYRVEEVHIRLESHDSLSLYFPDNSLRKRLPISSINGTQLTCRNTATSAMSSPDFGVDGDFQQLLRLRLDGIKDVIAHLKDIKACVENWPEHPDSLVFETIEVERIEYWKKEIGPGGSVQQTTGQ